MYYDFANVVIKTKIDYTETSSINYPIFIHLG